MVTLPAVLVGVTWPRHTQMSGVVRTTHLSSRLACVCCALADERRGHRPFYLRCGWDRSGLSLICYWCAVEVNSPEAIDSWKIDDSIFQRNEKV